MATQEEIDALTQTLTDAVTRIQAEIATLEANHPDLDLTGLKAEVEAVGNISPPKAEEEG